MAIVFFIARIIVTNLYSSKQKEKDNELEANTSLSNIQYNEFQIQMFKEE
jgi:preprotein translocase subunit SecG